MAGILSTLERLFEATVGFFEQMETLGRIATSQSDPLDEYVQKLREMPAQDTAKKAALADFFNTVTGQQYTKAERKAAYDALLGTQRNQENMG